MAASLQTQVQGLCDAPPPPGLQRADSLLWGLPWGVLGSEELRLPLLGASSVPCTVLQAVTRTRPQTWMLGAVRGFSPEGGAPPPECLTQ
jgi:hypothetical protein